MVLCGEDGLSHAPDLKVQVGYKIDWAPKDIFMPSVDDSSWEKIFFFNKRHIFITTFVFRAKTVICELGESVFVYCTK